MCPVLDIYYMYIHIYYVYTYLLCIYWTRGVALFLLKKWSSLYSTLYHRGAVKVATFV